MIIYIYDNFDLKQIKDSGQAFRITEKDGVYTFIYLNHLLKIKQLNKYSYFISVSKDEWESIWIDYFDLNTNYSNISNININNDYLNKAIKFGKGIRILKQDPFEMYISYIISQHNNIPRIRSTVDLLCNNHGKLLDSNVYAFPLYEDIKDISEADWKSIYHLGYRARYIKHFLDNYSNEIYNYKNKSDTELYKYAKSFLGIGDKIASCILLFAYHRLNFVPKDVWINRIISTKFNNINLFEQYQNIAGILQQYVYYYARYSK